MSESDISASGASSEDLVTPVLTPPLAVSVGDGRGVGVQGGDALLVVSLRKGFNFTVEINGLFH